MIEWWWIIVAVIAVPIVLAVAWWVYTFINPYLGR